MTSFLVASLIAVAWSAEPSASTSAGISEKMRKLRPALQELLVDLSHDDFLKGKNQARVQKRALEIADLAHAVETMKPSEARDADPSLAILAAELSGDFRRAAKDLQAGRRAYARDVLRASTQYCIACHSRGSSGPSFPGSQAPELKGMSALSKSEFLIATRQYDAASDALESLIAEPKRLNPFDWERAIGLGLVVAVRVKKDPALAERMVQRVLATPKLPAFLKTRAEGWMTSVQAWKSDPKDLPTEAGHYAEVVRLYTLAKTHQKYPADRSADVDFLRATSVMHGFLTAYPKSEKVSEVLLLLGTSYSVLQGLGIWDLGEKYFVACVKGSPHSPVALKCFEQLQEGVYSGFTGTGGTSVPDEEQQRLDKLEALATP